MPNRASRDGLVVVIGGTGSIGGAIIACAKEDGWDVLATARRLPPAASRGGVRWTVFDPAKPETSERLAHETALASPLRAIFFCIGAGSSKLSVAKTAPEEFELLYRDNVLSLVIAWRALAKSARDGGAALVALSSDATATLRAGNAAYTAAKAALEALVVTLAREEAVHGVRANVLAPSLVRSPMAEAVIGLKGISDPLRHYKTLPWGRALESDEVARAAIDIGVSETWRYASGQVFRLAVRADG
jgi:3-oxoacyl-[acyl-carrier protein] reductase